MFTLHPDRVFFGSWHCNNLFCWCCLCVCCDVINCGLYCSGSCVSNCGSTTAVMALFISVALCSAGTSNAADLALVTVSTIRCFAAVEVALVVSVLLSSVVLIAAGLVLVTVGTVLVCKCVVVLFRLDCS